MAQDTNVQAVNESPAAPPAVPDVFPDFAVSLEEANRRVKMLAEFVRSHMVEGEDYGMVPGTNTKPTLFKAGAEKLNAIFGLAPIVEITNRVEDWDNGFVAYEVKVKLINKRTDGVEAEGIGSCNSRERRYRNQDAANIANTILKMSKKRALVDATLSATRASGMFTQDLEDIEIDQAERDRAERVPAPTGQPRFEPAAQVHERRAHNFAPGSRDTLTDAQRGAILAIANKVFGATTQEELAKLTDKPVTQLSKSEASALIDRLRGIAVEQGTQHPVGDPAPARAGYHRSRDGASPR